MWCQITFLTDRKHWASLPRLCCRVIIPTINGFRMERGTAMPAEKNGDLQTLICVLVARPRWCPTLSNPVPWQNWMAAYLGYTLRMKMLFRGWPVIVNDMHTRRRRLPLSLLSYSLLTCKLCCNMNWHKTVNSCTWLSQLWDFDEQITSIHFLWVTTQCSYLDSTMWPDFHHPISAAWYNTAVLKSYQHTHALWQWYWPLFWCTSVSRLYWLRRHYHVKDIAGHSTKLNKNNKDRSSDSQ